MNGHLVQRRKYGRDDFRWAIVVEHGHVFDEKTGRLKRKQTWIAYRGSKDEAQIKLREELHKADKGEFVEPSRLTLLAHLTTWLENTIKPNKRKATFNTFKNAIAHVSKQTIAQARIQRLRPSHLEQYYRELTALKASPATVQLHHSMLRLALEKAVTDGLLARNPAAKNIARPKPPKKASDNVRDNYWTASEARAFLTAARAEGPQTLAFFAVALDSGARISELLGLRWKDVTLDKGTITIAEQLDGFTDPPTFGPPKTESSKRDIDLSKDTIDLLRAHKAQQAELKMRNRLVYRDFGLVFAREHANLRTRDEKLGQPMRTLHDYAFPRITKAAGVRPITFHGLRHTMATLLIAHGEPIPVVSKRLGHSNTSTTMNIYVHVLPGQGAHAAATMGGLIYG